MLEQCSIKQNALTISRLAELLANKVLMISENGPIQSQLLAIVLHNECDFPVPSRRQASRSCAARDKD